MSKQVFSVVSHGKQLVPVVVEITKTKTALPRFTIIGLAQKQVQESKQRVLSALRQSGIFLPHSRVTVNLQPVDIPKSESVLDLALALALLQVHKLIPTEQYAAIGELGLDGKIIVPKGVYGFLGYLLKSHSLVWTPNLKFPSEIIDLYGSKIQPASSLNEVIEICQHSRKQNKPLILSSKKQLESKVLPTHYSQGLLSVLEICLAGNHHSLLIGSPGLGKSHAQEVVDYLIPALNAKQAWERQQTLQSADWQANKKRTLVLENTSTVFQLVGSKSKSGYLSLLHFGVLFLDELPNFRPSLLSCLRKVLENQPSRGGIHAEEWSPSFVSIATCNPCPCSYQGTTKCNCSAEEIQKHFNRISGPLWDRFDITWRVGKQDIKVMTRADWQESKERICRAREAQLIRAAQNSNFPQFAGQYQYEQLSTLFNEKAIFDNLTSKHSSWRKAIQQARVACTIADLQGEKVDQQHLDLASFLQMELQ